MDNKKTTEILRQEESWEILSSIKDLKTNQLLNKATMCIVHTYMNSKEQPVSNFDLRFFVEAMLEFCNDHETLKRILAGEDLRWFDDEEIENPNLIEQPTQQNV
jgi:hypothetical protein